MVPPPYFLKFCVTFLLFVVAYIEERYGGAGICEQVMEA